MTLRTSAWAAIFLPGAAAAAMAQPTVPAPASIIAAPTCEKPDAKALEDRPGNDSSAVMAYNAKVHRYNRMSAAFSTCTKAYIDTVNHEIDRLRAATQERLKQTVDRSNARIRTIEAQINAAIAAASGAAPPVTAASVIANPDPDFPPPSCVKPDDAAPQAQRRAYEACTRAYITKGSEQIEHIKTGADQDQQRIAADTNRRIELLNTLAQQGADGDNDAARATIAQLDANAAPPPR